ncbi:MAG: NF038122 family metalloprotease [Verrucomicrobiota bacterium]
MKKHTHWLCLLVVFLIPTAKIGAMVINIKYDATVTNLMNPAQVVPAVTSAVQWFQNQYTNPITINITVAFSSSVSLGQSSFSLLSKSYSQVTNALNSRRVSAADFSSVASLPANDPTGASTTWYVARAQCKALGLSGVSPNDATTDGTVTFSSTKSYTFDPTNRAVAGKFDFIGVFQHEVSEVMGRGFLLHYQLPGYLVYDLFRYTNSAARSFGTNDSNVYFSVDNGATVQKYFYNDVRFGDVQDWVSSTPQDSYDAFVSSGKQSVISTADILSLDVLGYNMPNVTPPILAATRSGNGVVRLVFNSLANQTFTVLAATNVNVPTASWSVLGAATEYSTGAYQFFDSQAPANSQRFYRVRTP